jgi:hypothetical protein
MLPLYDMHEMNMQWGWHKNVWLLFLNPELHLKILFILHSQQTVSVIKIIAVCSDIHTKYINTMCGHDVEFLNVKPGGIYSNNWTLKG